MQNLLETNILEKSNTKELSSKKLEGGKKFQLITEYTPAGDQPKAISFLSLRSKWLPPTSTDSAAFKCSSNFGSLLTAL